MATVQAVTNYVIMQVSEEERELSLLKLQKLLYYTQAWHLAHYSTQLFPARFQAWVHGPVCREVYDRFRDAYSLYSGIPATEVPANFDPDAEFTEQERELIDSVLDVYAGFTGSQLEQMTHQEDPWMEARRGVPPAARSENELNEETMRRFYSARIAHNA